MRRFLFYFLYTLFVISLLLLGSKIIELLRILSGRTFNPVPLYLFYTFYSVLIGLVVAMPHLIKNWRQEGKLSLNTNKLLGVGIPALGANLSLILYALSPLGKIIPQVFLFFYNLKIISISGMIFGYIVLTSLEKREQKRTTVIESQRFFAYFIHTTLIIVLLALVVRYEQPFPIGFTGDFFTLPILFHFTLSPIIVGALFALPSLIKRLMNRSKLKLDLIKMLAVGVPTFVGSISIFLIKSSIWPGVVIPIGVVDYYLSALCGFIFGFIVFTSYTVSDES